MGLHLHYHEQGCLIYAVTMKIDLKIVTVLLFPYSQNDRSRRQDLLGGLLMSLVLRTTTNCAPLSNACLDLKGCLMTREAQDGNWFMSIMRMTSCLLAMIHGSKFSSRYKSDSCLFKYL